MSLRLPHVLDCNRFRLDSDLTVYRFNRQLPDYDELLAHGIAYETDVCGSVSRHRVHHHGGHNTGASFHPVCDQ